MAKLINTIQNGILPKARKVRGVTIHGEAAKDHTNGEYQYNAVIAEDGSEITLWGSRYGKGYYKEFKLGDMAEYDSYNLRYYGTIVKITDKAVTIQERHGREKRVHRLDLHTFAWRNADFDLAKTQEYNAAESLCI